MKLCSSTTGSCSWSYVCTVLVWCLWSCTFGKKPRCPKEQPDPTRCQGGWSFRHHQKGSLPKTLEGIGVPMGRDWYRRPLYSWSSVTRRFYLAHGAGLATDGLCLWGFTPYRIESSEKGVGRPLNEPPDHCQLQVHPRVMSGTFECMGEPDTCRCAEM